MKFEAEPAYSSRPFSEGDQVCFRPTKTEKWLRGKIVNSLLKNEEEVWYSITKEGGSSKEYQVPDSLIKSNRHQLDVLNRLDDLRPKHQKSQKKTANTSKKVKDSGAEQIKPSNPLKNCDGTLKNNTSDGIAQATMTGINTGIKQLDINQNWRESLGLAETIERMFQDNKQGTQGEIENEEGSEVVKDQASTEVMMKSLSKDQVETLVVIALKDFVNLSSSSSSVKVKILFIG